MSLPPLADGLARGFPAFASAVALLEEEWAPDEPPITVSMSELGRALAEGAGEHFSADEVAEIFLRVERIMALGTEAEKDAVATGFLEAVAAAIDRASERRWILDYAGAAARDYLEAWDRFCGVS